MTQPPFRGGHQGGGTLIELMVGLTVGLMVALAAMVSVSHTRQASSTLDADVALHQDAATVWRVLGLHLRQAGARRLRAVKGSQDVAFNAGFLPLTQGGVSSPVLGTAGNGNAPDSITTVFDGDALPNASCLGVDATLERIESRFEVLNGTVRCVSEVLISDRGAVQPKSANGALITGVQDLQLRYVQRVGAELQQLDTPTDWTAVVAVEACLHLASEPNGEIAAPVTNCAGQVVTPGDGRLHKVFRRVFQLRNQAR